MKKYKIGILLICSLLLIFISIVVYRNKSIWTSIYTYNKKTTDKSFNSYKVNAKISVNNYSVSIYDFYYDKDKKELHGAISYRKINDDVKLSVDMRLLTDNGEIKNRSLYEVNGLISTFQETWFSNIEKEKAQALIVYIDNYKVFVPLE